MFAKIGGQTPAASSGWAGKFKASAAGPATVIGPGVMGSPIRSAYKSAGHTTQDLASYFPRYTSGDSGTLYEQRLSLDRARDLVRNDPSAGAGVDRLVDMLVGDGWQIVPTPDARALGIDPAVARDLARVMRSEFRLFSRDPRKFCDRHRRMSFNGILRQAGRTIATGAEACAILGYDEARVAQGSRYATCVQPIDPDRLCNPYNMPPRPNLRGGVEFAADGGTPVAYHIREAHLADWWNSVEAMTWKRIERETAWGRPIFIHAYEPEREDQTRAVTPFAALVGLLRMLGKHSDTELANAVANSLFTATIESDLPTDEIADRLAGPRRGDAGTVRADYLDRVIDHFEKNPYAIGGVRAAVLPPGTGMKMNSTPRGTAAFGQFQTAFLRKIASRLGISYEQLSHDWSQTNYSSARAALNEVWRMIKRMQSVFAEQYVAPIYLAVLEEAFDRGYVAAPKGAPDFWDMPAAWAQFRYIGPGRGYIDPVKEAESAGLRMETLTSTLEIEQADQGLDFIDTLDQLQFEDEELKARGLTRQSVVQSVQSDKFARNENPEERGAKQAA
jgi:lambda family phage portal protein